MSQRVDITGNKYHRLTVVQYVGINRNKRTLWLCQCDCGKEAIVSGVNLRRGTTRSCGCYMRDRILETCTTHGHFSGGKQTRLYAIWAGIKRRCLNSHVKIYFRYGGRGIKVCPEWMKFEPFLEWATSNGYSDALSIDRIDNNGNYEPKNCRWATHKEQDNNRRSNKNITFNGKTKTIQAWAEYYGIKDATLRRRLKAGWTIEKALNTSVGRIIPCTACGE